MPVIASGGVGTLDHLVEGVLDGHADAVLAASIFHFGEHTVGEAKAAMAAAGIIVRHRLSGVEYRPKPCPMSAAGDKLPIKMLNDRILVKLEAGRRAADRRAASSSRPPRRCRSGWRGPRWWRSGPNVRAMEAGDQVLFNPEDRYEVEVRGDDYIILRERDVHAVAAERLEEGSTGLYL